MSNDRLKYLLEQYAADVSTSEETKELFGWIKKSKDDALLKEKIKELWAGHESDRQLPNVDWDAIYMKIINTPVIGKRHLWFRVAAAAVIITVLSVGSYFIFNDHPAKPIAKTKTQQQTRFENDLVPGGNKAVLTLANGAQIILDSATNGALTQQGNTKIIKLDNGQLSYNSLNGSSSSPKTGEILYNIISTPRGGQYQVVLADGSKVWLNAASSLRFPTSFTGKERDVALTGEGYFEVAHNATKPFKVSVMGTEIEVLGTHFNVNAYDDETTIKTTLLEGSVKVGKGSASKTIRPGEQAQIENHDNSLNPKIMIQAVDIDAAVAWKNGRFIFHGNDIQSVMRQLARWYDVDVSYQGNVTDEEFVGVINRSRYENISEILDMLEKTRTVSFAISGHHVTVMPFKK
jgi:ferric-dicitrate binding protein FerR (iron transport regulator)